MDYKTLGYDDAETLFNTFSPNFKFDFSGLSSEDLKLRNDLLNLSPNDIKGDYEYDLEFGLRIYEYFLNKPWFTIGVANDHDFWRDLCCRIVPDIVYKRHGATPSYYYTNPLRIYLSTLWWYIHLSFQGDIQKTRTALTGLSTDYIMQMEERPGKDGDYLEVRREIMRIIAKIPAEIRNPKIDGKNLFRRVMIQNTAVKRNFNLAIAGEVTQYVKDLFAACNVEVDSYE